MTVETNASSVTLAGNGATTSWPFAFLIPGAFDGDQSNVVLTVVDETVTPAVTTTILPGAYSITGVGNPAGGAVTYPLSGSPLAANMFITTQRVLAVVQSTEISNQGGFYPQVLEAALDYLTMLTQQQQAQIARSLQTAVTDPSGALQAIPVSRANTFLAFDANGQPIASAGAGSAPISVVMQAVVQAATLILARAAMGVPGLADNNTFTGTDLFNAAVTFAAAVVFNGAATLNGANTIAGAALSGTFTGTHTVSGKASFTGQTVSPEVALPAVTGTVTLDLSTGNNFGGTLTGNITLANPTNVAAGQSGVIRFTQDATGSRTITFGTEWKFQGGVKPPLTTTAAAVDYLTYYVKDSTTIIASLLGNLS